ncbi:MAG: hypothetical protein PVI86_00060 [Phycisphaerae bacterium]
MREKPGPGYRHVLRKNDVIDFISILPDWASLSKGLNAIILAPGDIHCDGWHDAGVVAVTAWEKVLWRTVSPEYYADHRDIFDRLEVERVKTANEYQCRFTLAQVRAYQLLHILLHELGHHHDRMTTRSKREASRGEGFAEQYALRHERLIWQRYTETLKLA